MLTINKIKNEGVGECILECMNRQSFKRNENIIREKIKNYDVLTKTERDDLLISINSIDTVTYFNCGYCGGPIIGNPIRDETESPIWYINSKQDNDSSNHKNWHLECIGIEKAEKIRDIWLQAMERNGLHIQQDEEQRWIDNCLTSAVNRDESLKPYTIAGICRGYNDDCDSCGEFLTEDRQDSDLRNVDFVKTGGRKRFHIHCFGDQRIKHMFLWWNWIATNQVDPGEMFKRSTEGWEPTKQTVSYAHKGRDGWINTEYKVRVDRLEHAYELKRIHAEIEHTERRVKELKDEEAQMR